MVSKRILTAAVCIPVVAYIIYGCDEKAFFVFIFAVLLAGLWEFFKMTIPKAPQATRLMGLAMGALVLVGAYHDAGANNAGDDCMLAGACVLSMAVLFCFHMRRPREQLRDAAGTAMAQIAGIMYVTFLGSFFILLRGRPDGVALIFFLLFVTWAGDTGAFAAGTLTGKHQLSRRISPKKTFEGALGSIACGVLVALLCKFIFLKSLSLDHCVALGLILNVLNQFGDMGESFIKRACNVKDSGSLFPGHGGVLDRIDSLLFAAPFLFYYMNMAFPV